MRGTVLYHQSSATTGKALARSLGATPRIRLSSGHRYDYIVRYGNSTEIENEPGIVINSSQGILNSSDKNTMKSILMDEGVPIPKIYELHGIHRHETEEIEDNFPVLVRPRHYSRGMFFVVLRTPGELRNFRYSHRNEHGWTIQKLLTNVREEYRIFVFNDRIFETNIKRPESRNPHPIIRNFDHGWTIKPIRRSLVPRGVQSKAKDATRAIGLMFSAVDMCYTEDRKIYVYEVNSAPGLYERKVDKLAERIKEYLEE